MRERYSIEVTDEVVEIYGDLTVEETFDFLNFYEKKGYNSVVLGSENSTLRMMKRDYEKEWENRRRLDVEDDLDTYTSLYKKEKEHHDQTKRRLNEVEALFKTMCTDESEKVKALRKTNALLEKQLLMGKLQNDKVFQTILHHNGWDSPVGCTPPGTDISDQIDKSRIFADPMEIPNVEDSHANE